MKRPSSPFRGMSRHGLIRSLVRFHSTLFEGLPPGALAQADGAAVALRDSVVGLGGNPDAFEVLCGMVIACEWAVRAPNPWSRREVADELLRLAALFASTLDQAGTRARFDQVVGGG